MKIKMMNWFGAILIMLGCAAGVTMPSYAASCEGSLFGLKPWYAGLTEDSGGSCVIKQPDGSADGIATFVWHIVLNVMYDLSLIVGILAVGFIIYGGFMYITSQGDPGKAKKGQKTLMSAAIGLVVALLASIIINTIIMILT